MKVYNELKLEELTVEQKLGIATVAFCWSPKYCDVAYIEKLVRNRSVGAVWFIKDNPENYPVMNHLREIADYPLLCFTDAESGLEEFLIGSHNAIGMVGSEESAYNFGKVIGVTALKKGFNVVCNPLLDMPKGNCTVCGGFARSLGSDKKKVTALAKAIARGMHDAGVLTVGKHYPGTGPNDGNPIDSHMAETSNDMTLEEFLDDNLYPYIELNKEGLLDGVMLQHTRCPNLDPDYPVSLSSKALQIFRDKGFEGFAITDALAMMGVVAKYGFHGGIALAIGNAGALALPFRNKNEEILENLKKAYDEGVIPDEKLNESVSRVLAAQHKLAAMQPKFDELTKEDIELFNRINTDSVYEKCDEGVSSCLDKNKKHAFVILTENEITVNGTGRAMEDTMGEDWYNPIRIANRLKELYHDSESFFISEYPTAGKVQETLNEVVKYDDTVFLSFYKTVAYTGIEAFTNRITGMLSAMQVSDQISTVLHFGNPFILETLPHIPRVIIGTMSAKGVEAGIDVLAGLYPAKGVLTYDVKLK